MLVNGKEETFTGRLTLEEFLLSQGYVPANIAVEYNGRILTKEEYAQTELTDKDILEIVRFVGGG